MRYLVTLLVILEIGFATATFNPKLLKCLLTYLTNTKLTDETIESYIKLNNITSEIERQNELLTKTHDSLIAKLKENESNDVMFVGSLCLNGIFLLTILALSFYILYKRHNQVNYSGFGKLNDTQFHFYNEVQFQTM
jgi:hypothetical protein